MGEKKVPSISWFVDNGRVYIRRPAVGVRGAKIEDTDLMCQLQEVGGQKTVSWVLSPDRRAKTWKAAEIRRG